MAKAIVGAVRHHGKVASYASSKELWHPIGLINEIHTAKNRATTRVPKSLLLKWLLHTVSIDGDQLTDDMAFQVLCIAAGGEGL